MATVSEDPDGFGADPLERDDDPPDLPPTEHQLALYRDLVIEVAALLAEEVAAIAAQTNRDLDALRRNGNGPS